MENNLQINVDLREIKPFEIFFPLLKHLSWQSASKEYVWESKSMVMFHKRKEELRCSLKVLWCCIGCVNEVHSL